MTPSTLSNALHAMATRIEQAICRTAERGDDDEKFYAFADPATERRFELRSSESVDAQGQVGSRVFMSEFVPNGRVCVYEQERLCGVRTDPRVLELERSAGPNGLMQAARQAGITTAHMVLVGGGLGRDSRWHPNLRACAEAIARALLANERYDCHQPLTPQQKTRFAREDAKAAHAYWQAEAQQLQATADEPGLFEGCSSMNQRLSQGTKERILAYLNAPSLGAWLAVRNLVITGSGTLWQAWCAIDPAATREGDGDEFPSKQQLTTAIRRAVARRKIEVRKRLKQTSASGLRIVQP